MAEREYLKPRAPSRADILAMVNDSRQFVNPVTLPLVKDGWPNPQSRPDVPGGVGLSYLMGTAEKPAFSHPKAREKYLSTQYGSMADKDRLR